MSYIVILMSFQTFTLLTMLLYTGMSSSALKLAGSQGKCNVIVKA